MANRKLSASAMNTFLRSPKAYYWQYKASLIPVQQSVITFDEAKICGILWAEFVNRFYNGEEETENRAKLLGDWKEQTDGWVPEKAQDRLNKALDTWSSSYYQMFNVDDGVRGKGKSELFVENDMFLGYLDGLSDDGIVHEVKSTSRSPQLMNQLWKVEHSMQVKLYCVLVDAKGYRIEFAFKDAPYQIFRGPEVTVTEAQKKGWDQEIRTLANYIHSLGDDPNNYVCHPDQCCLVTKGITSMCSYQLLCEEGLNSSNKYGYKAKQRREDIKK